MCERGQCNHDLARAVAVADLWEGDGPYPPSYLVVNLNSARAAVALEPEEEPVAQQRWAV